MTQLNHVNPGQTPVIALDQPLFALGKLIQWNWPSTHGEKKFILMFGGLRTEMAAFKLLGDWLDGSGWTSALVAAEVATGSQLLILSSKPLTSQELDGCTRLLPLVCSSCRVRHIVITLKPSRMVKNHSSLQTGSIKCPRSARSFCTGIESSS